VARGTETNPSLNHEGETMEGRTIHEGIDMTDWYAVEIRSMRS